MTEVAGFNVIAVLAEGPQFAVYRARRSADGVEGALKVVRGRDPEGSLARQLRREYELTHDLDGDAVARGLELLDEATAPALLREYRGDGTLSALRGGAPLDARSFCRVALAVARSLGSVHRAGVVHRDVKPSNVLCDAAGTRAWIADFGIAARLVGEHCPTPSDRVEGTLAYISPEQTGRTHRAVGPTSDLYSLGVVFFELLTGRRPFVANTPLEWVHAHVARPPPPVASLAPGVPPVLAAVVARLLEKDPDARYQSCESLARDLARVAEALDAGRDPGDFTLGEDDVPERFRRPQGLVGREALLGALTATFAGVAAGGSAVVRLRGESGAGKSSLVRALRRPAAERGALFGEGKHDAFQRALPYAALLGAVRSALRGLLTSDEAETAAARERIDAALRPNAAVLGEVLPELVALLGALSPAAPLGPQESEVRFQLAFRSLLEALASEARPLVLALDDVQWADEASLRLLTEVATRRLPHALLLLIERDGEPDPGGLRAAFWAAADAAGVLSTIEVGPFDDAGTRALVARVFPSGERDRDELAAVLRERTGGNAFATVEFLGALAEAGVARFDPAARRWRWDLAAARAAAVPDTAAGLVARRLSALDEPARRTLAAAAVVGSRYTTALVAAAARSTAADAHAHLDRAARAGLVVALGETPDGLSWRFAHDRVEEAAYALSSDAERPAAHALVARALRDRWPEPLDAERLFALVHHLGRGAAALDVDAVAPAAALARRAARVAREATAYRAALAHLALADALTRPGGPGSDRASRFAHEVERAECAYLATDFEELERAAAAALSLADGALDRARVAEVRVRDFNHRGEHARAVSTALAALAEIGHVLPAQPGNGDVMGGMVATRVKLGLRGPDDLDALPELRDPTQLTALRLMVNAASSAFFVAPTLFPVLAFRVVQTTLQRGATGLSAFGYVAYGLLLAAHFGQVDTGFRFGALARRTVDRFGAEPLRGQVEFVFNFFIRHWKEPLAHCARDMGLAARRALEAGSLEYWAYNLTGDDVTDLLRGVRLDALAPRLARTEAALRDLRQTKTVSLAESMRATLAALRGDADAAAREAAEEQVFQAYLASGDVNGAANVSVLRTFRRAALGAYPEALASAAVAEKHAAALAGQIYLPMLRFSQALALAATAPSLGVVERAKAHLKLRQLVGTYASWAKRAPANHGARAALLEAELSRAEGRPAEALDRYEEAMRRARSQDTAADAALVACRLASLHRAAGRDATARAAALDAMEQAETWGARALVASLEREYGPAPAASKGATSTSTSTRLVQLDFESALKAARAISQEIELDRLLRTLVEVVVENAGARRGAILRARADGLWVEAEARAGAETTLRAQPLEACDDLPRRLLQYVARTGETVLLDDAAASPEFGADPWVRKGGARSVLALALARQGVVTGVVYLEHDGTAGAFRPEHVEVGRVLAAQAAVSVENASLYADLRSSLRRQIELTEANGRFVPGEFLAALGRASIAEVALGDSVQKEMTVLFSDMRGFSRHVEGMSPEENIAFINEYLAAMEPAVLSEGGFVDSYIGDAIMALFADVPARAIAAAVDMHRRLGALNVERVARGRSPVAMGVGVNTGVLTLGTIGGPQRLKCGVIGDCVNLAARIESLTKWYGAGVLVGEHSLAGVPAGAFRTRAVDRVRVVGRLAPVTIYEVYDGDPAPLRAAKDAVRADWEAALAAYRAGELGDALAAFRRCREALPDDPVVALRQERCARHFEAPPAGPWTDIEDLTRK